MKKVMFFFLLFLVPSFVLASDTARSSIVMDIDSNRILYQKNANEKRLIASITKIMTATLAIESGKLEEEVEAGDEILKMYGTSIYLELHEKMKLKDLGIQFSQNLLRPNTSLTQNFLLSTETIYFIFKAVILRTNMMT